MYPAAELTELAARKIFLRRRIALRRVAIIIAAQRVARPLRLVDRLVAEWKRLSPLIKMAAVPLGALVGRRLTGKRRLIGTLMRWGPAIASVWRGLSAGRRQSETRMSV